MEPEEIDKLFKDRLAGLPALPSADAWQRLQQKMEPPKKERSLWIYYAAASVVILLISGILLIRTNNQNPGIANDTQRDTKTPLAQNPNPLIKENKEETRLAEQTLPKQETPDNTSQNKGVNTENTNQNSIAANLPKKTQEKLSHKLPKANKNIPGYVAVKKETKNSTDGDSEYKVASNNDSKNTEAKAFTLADNPQSAPEAPLTASIVEVTIKKNYPDESGGDENDLRENLAKKTLLLKNIYKQARNLKNGDPVELTALGVDKEKLQAETKEIKQKLNKVISL